MITNHKRRRTLPTGTKLWRNPTTRLLKIKVWEGKNRGPTVKSVEPGGTIAFPKAWPDRTVTKLCKFLVAADAAQTDPPPDTKPTPEAAPEAASAPLGDAGKVPSEDARKEPDHEATHSSGDALEAYATALMKKPKSALIGMAEGLGLDASGSKSTIARAIALKSIEGESD